MTLGRDFISGMILGVLISAFAAGLGVMASADPQEPPGTNPVNNEELAKLYEDDQSDRRPEGGKPIDPAVLVSRDRKRQARVKSLYETGALHTGKDYYRAAMVLQHASEPEDYLLAHEFCVVALSKGEPEARWLAAATEDRFLMKIKRPQRFGTRYHSHGLDDPVRLYEVGPGVTDGLRRELGVPTLEEARRREAEMSTLFRIKGPGSAKP
jgi:hypothetical protein